MNHQRVKVEWGVDGTVVDASATDPLPVDAIHMPAADRTTDTMASYPGVDVYMNNRTAVTPVDVVISASSSGSNTIVAAQGAAKVIVVVSVVLSAVTVVNAKFQSAATDKTGLLYLGATGGYVLPEHPKGWFRTAANEALNLNLSGAVAVGGVLKYYVL